MKLLVFILNKIEKLDQLVQEFAKHNITGATIINSSGLAHKIVDYNDETLSNIIGSLKKILNMNNRSNNTIFMVAKEERISEIIEIIESVVGSLDEPDTGLIFTLPIDFVKGMKH